METTMRFECSDEIGRVAFDVVIAGEDEVVSVTPVRIGSTYYALNGADPVADFFRLLDHAGEGFSEVDRFWREFDAAIAAKAA